MQNMSRLMTAAACGASAETVANGVLTKFSPDEWNAIGIIAGSVGAG
ncbi:phage holin [Sodalis praecaptivus]|nr:phage holin [Sodalis praecaptivus]